MDSLHPLKTLLAQAERERDAAQAEAQKLELAHRNAQRQGEQLQEYRREYEQRWSSQFARSGGIDIVHCYQAFVTRLGEAIDVQERITLQAAKRQERAKAEWLVHEMRVASVRKLIERRGSELQKAEERLEQKQLDEHAARLAWSRAAGGTLFSMV